MLTIPRSVRIFIGSTPIDMRKSIDGLMAIVQEELEQDAYSGFLFVFVSRRADRVKILTWDKGGFVLVYKRLERISEPPPEDLGAGELEKAEEVLGLPLPPADQAALAEQPSEEPLDAPAMAVAA